MKKTTKTLLWLIIIWVGYFATRLISLTQLPVFADEAIYIRWAQLIIDDWQQYLFFPLNDGKTPLLMWLTVPSLQLFADPLFAGRFISVLAGALQLWATIKIIKKLGGKTLAMGIAAISTIILPFWFFHHRMALIDGLLTAWLSMAMLFLLKTTDKKDSIKNTLIAGVFFGLAMLTKIPALLFMPALVFTPFLLVRKRSQIAAAASWGAGALLIGLVIFLGLKFHPAFGQLFNRGNDFLFAPNELLETGIFSVLATNLLGWLTAFNAYLTWPILLLPIIGLFQEKNRQKIVLLILSSLGFLVPILLLGKTIYPRYLLPAALPLTLAAALAFEQFFSYTQQQFKKPLTLIARSVLLVVMSTTIVSLSLEFMLISWKNPNLLPFTLADRVQYVQEWSAGHGIKEATQLMLESAKDQSIIIATEGFFGTLPDGVLMYLHKQNVDQLAVHGIGQPVRVIPDDFRKRAVDYEKVWLVVNSHREKMNLANSEATLLKSYPRVSGAPTLQIWDITPLVKTADVSL